MEASPPEPQPVENEQAPDEPAKKPHITAKDWLESGLIGMWKDRTDIGDTETFARKLRDQAVRRSTE